MMEPCYDNECCLNFCTLTNQSLSGITKLSFKNVNLNEDNVKSSKEFFSNLTTLSFDDCEIKSPCLVDILKQCSRLESLHLVRIQTAFKHVKYSKFLECENDLKDLRLSLINVTDLSLSNNVDICDVGLNRITDCMINLQHLDVNYNIGLTFMNVQKFITNRAEKLKSLKMCYIKINKNDFEVLHRSPILDLEELHIGGFESMDYEPLLKLMNKNSLRTLRLVETKLNIKSISEFNCLKNLILENGSQSLNSLENLNNLTSLTIQNLNTNILKGITVSNFKENLTGLHLIDLNYDLEMLKEAFPIVPNLAELTLQNCDYVDDSVVEQVFIYLKKLVNLNLGLCKYVFQLPVPKMNKALYENEEMLNYQDETSLDNYLNNFKHFQRCLPVMNLHNLEIICLRDTNIGDLTIISMKFDNLLEIDISYLEDITDRGFIALGLNNPSLKKVWMRCCLITDFGLLGMLQNTKDMANLDMGFCSEITSDSIMKIPKLFR